MIRIYSPQPPVIMPTLHNCHTHIFTTKNVPDDYFPLKLKDILARRHTSDFIVKLLHDLNPSDDIDRWDPGT